MVDSIIGQNDFSVISITDPNDRLLEEAYYNVLCKHFTNDDDLDRLNDIKLHLTKFGLNGNSFPKYLILVLIKDAKVVGTTIFGLFKNQEITFIKGEYTAILQKYRKNSAFNYLLTKRLEIVRKVFAENGCNDVDFIVNELESVVKTQGAKRAAIKTVKLWELAGFNRLDFDFVQLPLTDDKAVVTCFDLYIKPLSKKYIKKEFLNSNEMLPIINACQTFRVSDTPVETYIEYHNMLSQIDKKGKIEICRT